jgi:hypothetical protein
MFYSLEVVEERATAPRETKDTPQRTAGPLQQEPLRSKTRRNSRAVWSEATKTKGTLSRPLSCSGERLLLFLAGLFLLATLFLGCHVSILPFHSSWKRFLEKPQLMNV